MQSHPEQKATHEKMDTFIISCKDLLVPYTEDQLRNIFLNKTSDQVKEIMSEYHSLYSIYKELPFEFDELGKVLGDAKEIIMKGGIEAKTAESCLNSIIKES